MLDLVGRAAVGLEVGGKVLDGFVVPPRAGKQQPLALEVMHQGDIALSLAQASLVDAHQGHAGHAFLGACFFDVMAHALPQLLVRAAQHLHSQAHRHALAQRQGQRLERCSKAAAFVCPGHGHLARLAASDAGNAQHLGMQPGLELEEVQVAPVPLKLVMDALLGRLAVRTGCLFGLAVQLKINAPAAGVQLDLADHPGRLKTQRTGEQGFDSCTHFQLSSSG